MTRLGTLDYMAPEVLRCPDKYYPSDNKDRADLAYNEAVDSWAMGVLAYELIVGRSPFGMVSADGGRDPDSHCALLTSDNFPAQALNLLLLID